MVKQFQQIQRMEGIINILSALIVMVILSGLVMLVVVNVTGSHSMFNEVQPDEVLISSAQQRSVPVGY